MNANRSISTSSLAFIDVMSCGLGAVILLFVLLDFKTSDSEVPLANEPIASIEIDNNESKNIELLEQKLSINIKINNEQDEVDRLRKLISNLLFLKVNQDIELNTILENVTSEKVPENISSENLIGLNIKGKKILIALDTSASMSSRELIKIILGISDKSGQRLLTGDKWKQAKRALIWIINSAPEDSEINVLNYSDKVDQITLNWVNKSDALVSAQEMINKLLPSGGTSLGKLLEYIEDGPIAASDIYIITDGLPTMPGDKRSSLKALKECIKLPFSNNNYIKGLCREELFITAVKRFQNSSSSKINIILLPLEGDPKAASYYWAWSNLTNGLFLSPTKDWPST